MFGFFYVFDTKHTPQKEDFLRDFWMKMETNVSRMALGYFFSNGVRKNPNGSFILDSGITSPESFKEEPSPFGYASIRFEEDRVSFERDSLGIGNLFFSLGKDFLIVSTSQRPIIQYLKKTKRSISIDRQAFYESFSYRTTAVDRTLIAEISPIDFGTEYVFTLDTKESPSLFSKTKKFPISFEKTNEAENNPTKAYGEIFSEIIEKYPDDRDFSVLFTGGLDSTILLNAALQSKKRVWAFTVVGETECEDDRIARDFCTNHAIPHEIITLPNELEPLLRSAVQTMEDSDSVLCGLAISLKIAADRAKEVGASVLLSGSYVEPILGSNPSTLLMLKTLVYGWEYPPKNRRYSGNSRLLSEGESSEILALEVTANAKISVTEEYLSKLGNLLKEIFHGIGYQQKVPLETEDFFEKDFLNGIDTNRSIFSDCTYTVGETRKLFDLLTHTDLAYRGNIRNNLLNDRIGNNSEVPIIPIFAHSNLRNTVFQSEVSERFLPSEYPVTYADNKFFFKKALARFIPKELLDRKKTAASVPMYVLWLFDDRNSPFIRRSMEQLRSRKIFTPAVINLLLKIREKNVRIPRISMDELTSKGNEWQLTDIYMRAFWKMLALEIWMEEYID